MCDCNHARGYGWKGWRQLAGSPKAEIPCSTQGEWMDLSHPMDANLPRVPFFPEPRFERFFSIPEHILNVTRMDMVVHMGTHVDSPRHFFEDGPAFEDVPLDRLSGQGLVWRVDLSPGEDIEPRHLEECAHLLRADDILLLNTGSHLNVGTASYDDHPALTVDAARWIVEHDVKLLGVDTPTPDTAVKRREKGFDYPVHRLLLSHGVLILEHLTNLGALNGRRVELICAALNIVGGDGAPARVVGRALEK